jgi:hypothetical protein
MGDPRPFDHRQHDAFQRLIEMHSLPESVALKKSVTQAVLDGLSRLTAQLESSRAGRTSVRVALRQMKALGISSPALSVWLEAFDRIDHEANDEDDASRQHEH